MTVRLNRLAALLASLLAPAAALAQDATPGNDIVLPDIDIVAPAPAAASSIAPGIDRAKLPGTVEVLSAQDIARVGSPSVVDALGQLLPGVSLSDTQGNDLTQDLRYRGFAASPLQGTPQGLAVYQNGVRLNEAFGDTLNWDLVPPDAIHSIDLFGSNPAFGLNAIGGAVSIEMKNGFTWQGLETSLRGGSYGRVEGALQYGIRRGPWAAYLATDVERDGGWRFQSASHVERLYADIGYRDGGRELHLVLAGAGDALGVIGPTPIELTRADPRAIFTWPQTTRNQTGSAALNGSVALNDAWTLQGNVYVRVFHQQHVDGNIADFEACSARSSFPGLLCLEDDAFGTPPGGKTTAFRNQFLILGPGNATYPFAAGTPYGTIDTTSTRTTTLGASLQATGTGSVLGHGNTAAVGASVDRSAFDFSASSTLGYLFPDLSVGFDAPVPGMGAGPLRTLGNVGYAPVAIAGDITYVGLYASDTFDLTERLAVSFGGRLNLAWTATRDTTGAAPDLTASHGFSRFNPFAGATFKLTPALSVYGGYAEANRVPTPLELSCSDPVRPCLLANSLVADPALKQVVARSYELGLRGSHALGARQRLTWRLGLFRTDSSDDILALASTLQGRGYYANVPGTRRQGVEAAAQYRGGRWQLYANYALVDATFRFAGTLASPSSPSADADGNILVRPGDRMPLVPRHQVKLGATYLIAPAWEVGADLVAFSSQFFSGDESNRNKPLAGWWSVNLHGSYQVSERVQVFADIRNLFNRRYATYGTYFETGSVANAIPLALNDPRSVTLAQPLSVYGGVRLTW
jgi:iron complex outermembrane receptor protein